jgi:hypothetical protein
MGNYSSFVVRLWVDSNGAMMRGHIQHVTTQKETFFLDFDKMLDFMNRNLESLPHDLSGSPQSNQFDVIRDE